jgi:hypothetical protein
MRNLRKYHWKALKVEDSMRRKPISSQEGIQQDFKGHSFDLAKQFLFLSFLASALQAYLLLFTCLI